jgi:hypothetical protein
VSAPLVLGALWVIASAIVAMLPMGAQMVPGLALVISAPLLLVWLALGLIGCVSMFGNPLRHFARRAPGHQAPLPTELEQ